MNRSLTVAALLLVTMFGSSCSSDTSLTPSDAEESRRSNVGSISVSLIAATAQPGQTVQASAVVRNLNGNQITRSVSWSSSNTAVATVSSEGVVMAIAAGTAQIRASIGDVSGSALLTVASSTPPPASVASVSVALASSSTTVGQTVQATATTRDAASNILTGRSVTWSSSNTSIAIVSDNGLVTALANGSAQVTATSEGKTGSATLVIAATPPAPVASVSVTLNSPGLTVGQTTQANATTRDGGGSLLTGRSIAWSSSNGAVATVSASGVVTAAAAGSATITATSEGVTGGATVTVTVAAPDPVASVSVALTATNLIVAQTTQGTATTRDASGNVLTGRVITWSSSNTALATVSSSGLVTAVAAGTAQITATSETMTGTVTVTITPPAPIPVASVSVALAANSLIAAQTTQASATTRDASNNVLTGRTIDWTSSNTAVATVSASGLVTAVAAGTTQITATSEGKTGSAALTVTVVPVATVSVTLNSSSLTVSQTTQANAVTKDASNNVLTGRVIDWTSSNTAVATVSSAGVVTAVAAGTAQITATSETKVGSAALAVTVPAPVPVASVSVALNSSSLIIAQTTQATATTRDAGNNVLTGRVITWGSSNTAVATVSSSGVVTAVAAGSASITATSENQTGSATLTVTAPAPVPVNSVSVSLAASALTTAQTTQATATTRDASNNILTGRVILWSSSNTGVATVSASGVVTAVAAGTASITATSENKTGSATVTVTTPSQSAGCASPQPGWIWCDDFETNKLASYFEYDNAGGNFARAAGVGANGSMGMRVHFNAGATNAGSLKLAFGRTPLSYFRPVDAGTANYREIFWRIRVKNQAGWTGGGGDKLSRATILANGNWAQAMIAHVWSAGGSQNDKLAIDPVSGTDAAGNLMTTQYNDFNNFRWLGLVASQTPIFDAAHVGQWRCIEAHAKLNDAGSSNGVQELWIDGALEAQHTNMNFVGSYSAYGINAVFFESYWNAGSPVAQERYFDDIVVSTQRIGC